MYLGSSGLRTLSFGLSRNLSCSVICRSRTEPENLQLPTSTEDVAVAVSTRPPLPIITSRKLNFLEPFHSPRQAWVENLDTIKEDKLGLVDLHPDVFAAFPRVDILHLNIHWQQKYQFVDWRCLPTRAEMSGGGRKPRPQKGTGRARHGSIRSPIFYSGAKAHGPRGPKSHFYMLPFRQRVMGLTAALSVKLAQDDLKIVDNLEIPTEDPKYIPSLMEERGWGLSTLIVDDTDYMPKNISVATANVTHINLMPAYGLNVYSMLKHDTLVLTLAALERIEERILFHIHKLNRECDKFRMDQQ